MSRRQLLRFVVIAIAIVTAPTLTADDPPPFKHENKADNLKALFELLHKTVHVTKDNKKAAALFSSLIPDEARLNKALADNVPEATRRAIAAQHKKFAQVSEADAARLARPEQKVVKVHAATTEELARYQKGSTAYTHFPGGAQRLAKDLLRPKATFYEVEYLAPGKERGIKYHLFYWDGKRWSMLGPMWRVVK